MSNAGEQRKLPILLLIDDDLVSREVMATVLAMSGYLVHTAEDGAAALRMLDGGECIPDSILMDAQMPGLSGASLIAELRSRTSARVLAISASAAPEAVMSAADGFLQKPFDAVALQGALEKANAQAEPPRESEADSEYPVVNGKVLAQLRQLMPESAVRQIFAAMVTDLGTRIEALETAIAEGDADEVRRIGHAIKGGCGMVGAMQAARLGALLEAAPTGGEGNFLDNNIALLRDLRSAASTLERMLEAELPA